MHLHSRILFTLISVIILCIGFVNPQVFAESEHYTQISGHSRKVLSPAVSLNTSMTMKSFTNLFRQMKRQTLYTPRDDNKHKFSLTDRFGKASIKNVLDVATGSGSWMRQVPAQQWAATDVSVIGLELEEPDPYMKQPNSLVNKQKDWLGLDIIHSFSDLIFKKKGTTLINETLIDKKGFNDLTDRLNKYDQILEQGGWLTLANIQHAAYIQFEHFTKWLDSKQKYQYQVLFPLRDHIPDDYPKSFWWNHFENDFLAAKHLAPPYLIVAQKIAPNNQTNLFEQSI